jgi:hypothetical protein
MTRSVRDMRHRFFAAFVALSFLFIFVAAPSISLAASPADLAWKLTWAEGNHLLKAHLNASASQIADGKTTIHIHGQNPIVMDQKNPNVKATLEGLEEGKSYQGDITFEGTVAGQKVTVTECFTLDVAIPGKSLNKKHVLKLGECDQVVTTPEAPKNKQPDQGDKKDQATGGDNQNNQDNQSKENQKGGKMPKTASSEPIYLFMGSLALVAGIVLLKWRQVTDKGI